MLVKQSKQRIRQKTREKERQHNTQDHDDICHGQIVVEPVFGLNGVDGTAMRLMYEELRRPRR